jgi:hypothetical protein
LSPGAYDTYSNSFGEESESAKTVSVPSFPTPGAGGILFVEELQLNNEKKKPSIQRKRFIASRNIKWSISPGLPVNPQRMNPKIIKEKFYFID